MKYIHYGSDKFDVNKFTPIVNHDYNWTKPKSGGLWASSVNAEYGWKEWCTENDFLLDKLAKYFTFELSAGARICHIKSVNDLKKLPKRNDMIDSLFYLIDFEKASREYDAIELHLSDEVNNSDDYGLYFKLYGWDCDSILIMNRDIVNE